ncbi:hypothetical protein KM043_015970 [Ampulex compressa]|nr:hypothetical protein KM043_015970 [Ampulex compressa]
MAISGEVPAPEWPTQEKQGGRWGGGKKDGEGGRKRAMGQGNGRGMRRRGMGRGTRRGERGGDGRLVSATPVPGRAPVWPGTDAVGREAAAAGRECAPGGGCRSAFATATSPTFLPGFPHSNAPTWIHSSSSVRNERGAE